MFSRKILLIRCSIPIQRRWAALKIQSKGGDPNKYVDLSEFKAENIRNFSIVAHVDHGKSTLADRLLQQCGVIDKDERKQFLDKLQVEQERGITVKAQTCSMVYKDYLFNLIDTPGHVDFSFEVSRSLAACDGMLLLVAANAGVQAQTVANFWLGFENDLVILPVINKIDLPGAEPDIVNAQLCSVFDFNKDDAIRISAKTGLGVSEILDHIIEKVPPPKSDKSKPFRALIFDSWYEHFRGAIALLLVKEGEIKVGQKIKSYHNDKEYDVAEVGIMYPDMVKAVSLSAGQVGYVVCSMKTVKEAAVGETLYAGDVSKDSVTPFAGFKTMKPTVYAGLYPVEQAEYENLKQALERLALNDPSVEISGDSSVALGLGFKVGFLGMLHMEVFGQRLDQEYDANVILTAPSVEYKALVKDNDTIRKKRYEGRGELSITDPSKFPAEVQDIDYFLEPMVQLTIICPNEYMSQVTALCTEARGERGDINTIDESRMIIKYRVPLAEVVVNFFEKLKRSTSGYASFDYEYDGYQEVDLVKLNVTINQRQIDEFSLICPSQLVRQKAKDLMNRLKEEIPRQLYEVNIKAHIGTSQKAVSQATIKAYKKDFTGLLKGNFGGGGMERLNKKLAHQKKGKERMKNVGNINIPKEAFINVLKH
ncbi:unnamed protein product [Bursaphelenchus okinawaensis]|uniref:Translation factor GUF1 homolog, mitochondrial n=1 Tax=Bursaphelenchus okinawaensis TaxID=465554 RepID=A0A811KD89_9BILA|nr:unnamed protein product [Bursaphelenchus okinawaensis]CAG9100905.1 unnamed protein product [Bursaphelenchus okinawaensis]